MYFFWGGLGRVKTKMVEGKNSSYFSMSISQAKYDISLEQGVTSTIRNNCFCPQLRVYIYIMIMIIIYYDYDCIYLYIYIYIHTGWKRVDRFNQGYDMNSCKVECSINAVHKYKYLMHEGTFG